MSVEILVAVAPVLAVFGVFGFALAYFDAIASARAITYEEEQAARHKMVPLRADAQEFKLVA